MKSIEQSERWHQRALKVIPGGVSSPVRAFSAVGGTPRYFVEGKGSRVFDVDGNEYVDMVGSWGPMIVGHAHPEVVRRVIEAASKSSSFGAASPNEVLLAEEIIKRVSAVERVRFVSSGTEAVMTAVRLARAATKRNVIVKFAGCYHGHADALLVQAGSGVLTLGLPNSPGVTPGQAQDTVVVAYNDFEAIKELFTKRGSEIAAVLTEAVPANMGVVPPAPGFNALLSRLCDENGALFILDEVMTGFRLSSGGWWHLVNAEESWTPDLITYGKVIGGGYPVAAVAGPAPQFDDVLAHAAQQRPGFRVQIANQCLEFGLPPQRFGQQGVEPGQQFRPHQGQRGNKLGWVQAPGFQLNRQIVGQGTGLGPQQVQQPQCGQHHECCHQQRHAKSSGPCARAAQAQQANIHRPGRECQNAGPQHGNDEWRQHQHHGATQGNDEQAQHGQTNGLGANELAQHQASPIM